MMQLIDLIEEWLQENQYTIYKERYGTASGTDFYIIFVTLYREPKDESVLDKITACRGFIVLENRVQIPNIHNAGITEILAYNHTMFEQLKNYLDAPRIWTYVSPDSYTYT